MPQVHIINPTKQAGAQKLRLAAYCRVSTDSSDQLNSYLAQINYYTKYISDNPDWELHDIYADEGITGTRADKREDFQRMLRDCRRGLINKIIVKSVSRFARNSKDCIAVVRELHSLGISVVFEKENLDTEKLGSELFLSMYSTFAQEESMSISGNMRWSYQKRMQSGRFITCRSCYGYDLIDGFLEVRDDEALLVKGIFEDFLSGTSMQEITDRLNLDKAPKRYEVENWHENTIRYILKNERYMGNAILQKQCTTKAIPFKKYVNRGQEPRYLLENSHPAIIEPTDFDAAQKLIEFRRHQDVDYTKRFLSGKIQCGECGSSFTRRTCNDTVYWICSRHYHGKENCPVRQVVESEIYAAFIRLWNTLQKHSGQILAPVLSGLQELQNRNAIKNTKLLDINKAIVELGEQSIVLNQLNSKGYIDKALYWEQVGSINNKIADLRRQRSQTLQTYEDDTVRQLRILTDIMENAEPLITFDNNCFDSIVDKIIVESQESIRFSLIGGIEFTENIRRNER